MHKTYLNPVPERERWTNALIDWFIEEMFKVFNDQSLVDRLDDAFSEYVNTMSYDELKDLYEDKFGKN